MKEQNIQRMMNSLEDFVVGLENDLSSTENMVNNNSQSPITLNRSLLTSTYLNHGVMQALIDTPVDDAFKNGIIIKCSEFSSDEIKEIESFIEKENILLTYAQALKWARLFGGSGIIINFGQQMDKSIDFDLLKQDTSLEFYAADRWELSYSPKGNSILDQFEKSNIIDCPYNYYGHIIHKENVIKLNNKEAPSLVRGHFSGWGVSEIEKVKRSWNQFTKHQNVTYELLDESKIDIIKLNDFNVGLLTADGAAATAQRVSFAAKIKNYQNALVLDKEDEYEQKTLAFGGLAEILTQIRIGLACDLRMPMTKLFGLSASGFSSGEEDLENYNAMIESEIRSKSKTGLTKILKIICKKLFDYIPESLSFDYQPLRTMSARELSTVKTDTLNRIVTVINSGLCPTDKAIDLINNEKIFNVDLDENEALSIEEMKEIDINEIGRDKLRAV